MKPSRTLHKTIAALFSLGVLLAACGTPDPSTPGVMTQSSMSATAPAVLPTHPVTNAEPAGGGSLVLSMTENGISHLFAFSPSGLTLTRLTADPWEDIAPAASPDGSQLAYASRRNGYWDLYLLDLASGEVTRLTDTPEYESNPSWSPDGQWLVYESNLEGNLDLYILSVNDPAQAPIRLTDDPAADRCPTWAPGGRQVAFVSGRSGQEDIWMVDLGDASADRYTNLSNTPTQIEDHPAWSPDGSRIAWSGTDGVGLSSIFVASLDDTGAPQRRAGTGTWPTWQDEGSLLSVSMAPNQWLLSGFTYPGGAATLALVPFSGTIRGITWLPAGLPAPLAAAFKQAGAYVPGSLYTLANPERTGVPAGRAALVPLEDVQVSYPQLHDAAVDSFNALRLHTAAETGWDVLASLANAYIPLTTPLDPGLQEDWLYTGRAVALNPLLANAGWIAPMREDLNGLTYWRLYVRTLAQDGSQGIPLPRSPWNFNARFAGEPALYDQGGGTLEAVPSGYWFDLTALAAEYGWQRLPALPNWRTYAPGALFTEFAFTQGLDWHTAMLELYPPEALVTPTVVVPPTRTPTATPWFYRTPTPTRTPTPRPTLTPAP